MSAKSLGQRGVGKDRRWFYPASSGIMGFVMFYYIWTILFPYIQNQFGLETTAGIALGSSLAGLGTMVLIPPLLGTILDRTKSAVVPSLVAAGLVALGGIAFAMLTTTESWATGKWLWWASSFLLAGGASAVVTGIIPPLVSQWYSDEEQGGAQGMMVGIRYLVIAALSPIFGGLLNYLGFSIGLSILVTTVSVAIIIALGAFFWRFPTAEEQSAILGTTDSDESESEVGDGMTFREAAKDIRFWVLFVAMTSAAFSFTGFMQNFSLILVEGLVEKGGYNEAFITGTVVPTFLSINFIFLGIGSFLWGRIMDRLGGPFRTLILVYGIPATLFGVFYLTYTQLYLVLAVGALIFLGLGGEPPVHYAAVPNFFGRENVGKILTYINAASVGTGMFLGPVVFAYVNDVTGVYLASFALALGIRFVAAGAAFVGTRVAPQ